MPDDTQILFQLIDRLNIETMKNGKRLQKLLELEEERMNAIEGRPFFNRFTIPSGHQVVKIHLEDEGQFRETHPENVSFYLPGRAVASVYIYNEGPNNLNFSYNTPINQGFVNSFLLSGEDRQINTIRRVIKSLYFVAPGGTTVRFEAIA